MTVPAHRRSIGLSPLATHPWNHEQGRFNDATSAETAAYCDSIRSDYRIAAKPTNGAPGKGSSGPHQ